MILIFWKRILIGFVFLFPTISHVNSQNISNRNCTEISPIIILDCSIASTDNNSCCFYKINGQPYCKWWGSKFRGTVTHTDGITYQCDNPRGTVCGDPNPTSIKDCDKFSASTNSCCYFKTNTTSGCRWWGASFNGTTYLEGVVLKCGSEIIKFSLLILLINLILIN